MIGRQVTVPPGYVKVCPAVHVSVPLLVAHALTTDVMSYGAMSSQRFGDRSERKGMARAFGAAFANHLCITEDALKGCCAW